MLLRVLKNLLRALPWMLGLFLLTTLISKHGQRLSIDGVSPLAEDWQQLMLLVPLYGLALLGFWLMRRKRKARARRDAARAQAALEQQAEPSPRELRLREQLQQWRLSRKAQGARPTVLMLGWPGVGKRTLLGNGEQARSSDNAEDVAPQADLEIVQVGHFSVLAASGALLTQRELNETLLWQCLLDELRAASRTGRTLSGVVLVLSAEHLQQAGQLGRDQQAMILRSRLEHLASQFGAGVPLQLIVTHCDRLPGYEPSILALPTTQRELGIDLPVASNRHNLTALAERLGQPLDHLQASLFERLQREPLTQERTRLYGFPQTWRRFARHLQQFLEIALREQPGVPQARLQALRFSGQLQADGHPEGAGVHVLTRVLQQSRRHGVADRLHARVQHWFGRHGGYVIGLGLLCLLVVLANNFRQHNRHLAQLATAHEQLNVQPPLLPAAAFDTSWLEHLNRLRAMAHIPSDNWPHPSFWLAQHRHLQAHVDERYQQSLRALLLTPAINRLRAELEQASSANAYELLRIYLILGGKGPLDAIAIDDWLSAQADGQFGAALDRGERQQLHLHFAALRSGLDDAPLLQVDDELVELVRQRIARESLSERLYQQLMRRLDDPSRVDFSVMGISGSEGMLLIDRRSGAPLNRGVPQHFTRHGEERLHVQLEATLGRALHEDHWVMGQGTRTELAAVRARILERYHDQYIDHWQRFLTDLKLTGLNQHEQLPRRLQWLASDDSPLLVLLKAADDETRLSHPVPAPGRLEQVRGWVSAWRGGEAAKPATSRAEPHPVTQHFAPLHRVFEGVEGQPGQLALLREALKQAATHLAAQDVAIQAGLAAPDGNSLDRLRQQIDQMPLLLQPMFEEVVSVGRDFARNHAVQVLEADWAASLGPYCSRVVEHGYPFDRMAHEQVPLADFNRLFAHDGVLEDFFQQHLAGLVDTRSQPWKMFDGQEAAVSLAPATLVQLQHAARIRQLFFANSAEAAQVEFEVSPLTLDEQIAHFSLASGHQQLHYAHGPIQPTPFSWPNPTPGTPLKAVVTLLDGSTRQLSAVGPWAWFRLLDQGRLDPVPNSAAHHLTLDFDGYPVVLELRSNRLDQPFGSSVLGDFRCPGSLTLPTLGA